MGYQVDNTHKKQENNATLTWGQLEEHVTIQAELDILDHAKRFLYALDTSVIADDLERALLKRVCPIQTIISSSKIKLFFVVLPSLQHHG